MGLLVLILIILLLAAWGILGFILKVALGVALGVFFALLLAAGLVAWRVRRFFRGPQNRWRSVRGSGGSKIDVLEPRDEP